MSTKNVLGRPWVEFVLGIDQVIKGFDRALPLMSVGERSTIVISPEYACKYSRFLPPYITCMMRLIGAYILLACCCRRKRRASPSHSS